MATMVAMVVARDRAHAGRGVQQGVADVGDEHPDDPDHAELGSLVDQLPEPLVQPADNSHQAPILPRVPSPEW